jgi:glycosyltransferase involved in cell wall biosynthesis
MPGFLPRERLGARVLHQATEHPETVRAALAAARRTAGGGRGFLTRRETRLLVAELAHADLIRAESTRVRDGLLAHGIDASRVVMAHPGVDCTRFHPGTRANELTVAFIGTLSLWKGVDVLVDFARRVRGQARVVVIGGPVCPWSRRLVENAGFEFHTDPASLLASAHALILPSVTDGFGYVVLEAMASGAIPFVSPNVGAAEIVRTIHPDLVQPRASFSTAVPELLASLSLSDLSSKARAVASTMERTAQARLAAARVLELLSE